ncbi:hypothetical protein EST38_g4000 [Candolleomyces aberdarensis]|uniref:Uncharacterized protein n=1 Tax=Candolleomyces aberdarensis TaxID=2316362 RepID=A0A4Q2DNM6_9AGAR|nr:hypothetical protein EST38_g4000 [Candolleomyces aberdarensis]
MSPADIISPCPLPLVEDQKPLVYIIKVRNDGDEDDDNYSDTFKLHWYQFRFNSDNPGSSILTLLDTTSPGSDYKNGLNPHATYYMYEDQIAIIWEDENDSEGHDSFYLSLFPIPNSLLSASSSPHAGISDSQGKKEDNFKIVPFARYPVAPDDDTVPVVLDQAFCIHTGKAIVHCWTPENDARWVDWYNFVEKRD